MALKKIKENPKVTDTILIEITTPDADGCFNSNPYKVDRVTVYYVERDFLGDNYGEYTKTVFNDDLQLELDQAKVDFCNDPSAVNALKIQNLQIKADSLSQSTTFFYKDRVTVKVIGSTDFPAWLSTDVDNAFLTLESEDADGNTQYGHYSYEWNPQGSVREGDYFVCWTWTPLSSGEQISAHLPFSLLGDPKAVITIPTHITPDEKYDTLLERYLPEMYKGTLTNNDLTPQVTALLNQAVGQGFKFLEDMANQVIDLFDSNALHESLLVYLSNLFNIRLKSNDPTLWRRQIKEAIPLFKKKGTLGGLKDAFAQAGMQLNKYTQYWQIVSPYTWIETFNVIDSSDFELSKSNIVTPVDEDNFGLWLQRENSSYTQLSSDYVEFSTKDDGTIVMTWIGDELSSSPIEIFEGDRIKVMYQFAEIPGVTEQGYEDYIRALPLMDQRDEDDQEYPPKNWNVKLISEEDPLFDILIPVRHPFHEWLIFGYVRTEFAYSENIYNMDEYNGSTRPSLDPCKIDKAFIDPCGACLSSCYTVDVAVEELSNDRMIEAQDILRENVPFHARLHSIDFTGDVNEYMQSPVETFDFLVTIDRSQFVLSGQSNPIFNRTMTGGLSEFIITRDDLTDDTTVLSGLTGTAYNDSVGLISPDVNLQDLGVDPNSHILEVLSPSANTGTYTISDISKNTARVSSSVIEPLTQTAFTFNISNINYSNSITTITQNDLFKFEDEEIDFATLGVKTLWDIENTPDYVGGAWKLLIPAYDAVTPFTIDDIQNGVIHLVGDHGTLPVTTTNNISYSLLNDSDVVIDTSTTGSLSVSRRAYVELNDSNLVEIHQIIGIGDYLLYNGDEYKITGFDGSNLWISDYSDGDGTGLNISIKRRLVESALGYFNYHGLRLITASDHESGLSIVNGNNAPSENNVTDDNHFKENYLFLIDGEYYKIAAIDGDRVVLQGRDQSWTTLADGGTTISYDVIWFEKNQIEVGFVVFDHLDRDGQDPVIREIESTIDDNVAVVALSAPGGLQQNVSQGEGISFIIEHRNGDVYEGEL